MPVKLSSKNQVTVPRKILAQMPDTRYLEVEWKDGMLILKPVAVLDANLEQIRHKMKKLGLTVDSVSEAIQGASADKESPVSGVLQWRHFFSSDLF